MAITDTMHKEVEGTPGGIIVESDDLHTGQKGTVTPMEEILHKLEQLDSSNKVIYQFRDWIRQAVSEGL